MCHLSTLHSTVKLIEHNLSQERKIHILLVSVFSSSQCPPFIVPDCRSGSQCSVGVGYYTQLVWQNTTHVGCGWTQFQYRGFPVIKRLLWIRDLRLSPASLDLITLISQMSPILSAGIFRELLGLQLRPQRQHLGQSGVRHSGGHLLLSLRGLRPGGGDVPGRRPLRELGGVVEVGLLQQDLWRGSEEEDQGVRGPHC